jgi:mRNA-degrading endonuclease toxin of MazEF toxin-antitoxin module
LIERGDVYFVDLEPTLGREQRGHRPIFVITKAAFNALSPPIVAPITSGGAYARRRGFAVSVAPYLTKVTGFVLCNQIRTIDLDERGARFVERAPHALIDEVLARIAALTA